MRGVGAVATVGIGGYILIAIVLPAIYDHIFGVLIALILLAILVKVVKR